MYGLKCWINSWNFRKEDWVLSLIGSTLKQHSIATENENLYYVYFDLKDTYPIIKDISL